MGCEGKVCHQKKFFCWELESGILALAVANSLVIFFAVLGVTSWDVNQFKYKVGLFGLFAAIRTATFWAAYCCQMKTPETNSRWCLFWVYLATAIGFFCQQFHYSYSQKYRKTYATLALALLLVEIGIATKIASWANKGEEKKR